MCRSAARAHGSRRQWVEHLGKRGVAPQPIGKVEMVDTLLEFGLLTEIELGHGNEAEAGEVVFVLGEFFKPRGIGIFDGLLPELELLEM